MRAISGFTDYELIDCSAGEKLERWGDILLIRPDPQILWNTPREDPRWQTAHARYHRSSSGGGHWETYRTVPPVWHVRYRDLTFALKPMGFKHTGLFPEQAVNWDLMASLLQKRPGAKVLNLFGYTGAATLACAAAGAQVTHVDAAKGMVAWAKDNAAASGLSDRPIRWLVDDCVKFVRREIRRGNHYDGIVMDPPSYGRGPGGEVWKLETNLWPFVSLCAGVLSDEPLFVLINSYTTGLSPSVLSYVSESIFTKKYGGRSESRELALPVTDSGLYLPCGASCRWES